MISKVREELKSARERKDDYKTIQIKNEKSINAMLEDLIQLSDEAWSEYAFSREPLEGRIKGALRNDLIEQTLDESAHYAQEISMMYENASPFELIKKMGLEFKQPLMESGADHVIFADFKEPNIISVYQDPLNQVEKILPELDLKITLEEIKAMFVLHEIFHYIEVQKKDEIITQVYELELWKIGPLANRSKVYCLGEIGGMQFVKEYLKLPYSPFILDVLMVYAYDKKAGQLIYENIMDIVHKI